MPHKAYGIKWPIYQEPEVKATRQDTFFNPTKPQETLHKDAHYWPPEALQFGYAWHCVEIALLHSQEASTAYYEAVKALELPGCQALISDTKKAVSAYAPNLQQFTQKVTAVARKGQFMLPGKLHKYSENGDYLTYIKHLSEFVRLDFNRQIDRDNEACKVKLESAPTLFGALIVRTIAEHCKVQLESWTKYRPDDINRIMTTNPTTRKERLKKRDYRQIYKRLKWVLRHDTKLLKDSAQWYKCRVNPGSIELYLNEQANQGIPLDRSRVENDIAAIDEAMGYSRKWRK